MTGVVLAATIVTNLVALLPGERWWGGGGGDGQNQPYGGGVSARIDLRTHGNVSAPLLVSSAGRVIWSERPFAYQFLDGKLVLESDAGKIEPEKVGDTLRDAYLHAAKAHFRFDGRIPPEEFFALPQWNNWIEIFLCGMNQKGTDDYTAELAASGFPCGIYMVDGGWLSHQGSYEFHSPDFPDPKGMFDRIREHGWIPLVWTANFVSPDSREYKRLRWHEVHDCLDALVHRRGHGREAAIVTWWSGKSCVYDLMRREGYDCYLKALRGFCAKYGVAGFKFDAGDAKGLAEECDFGPGLEAVDYVNRYAHFAATEFPYHEIRVGWKNGGEPNVVRLMDRAHAWVWNNQGDWGQRTIVPQMITAGLLGAPYAMADMVGGGLEVSFVKTKINETLFVRSAQMQAMMPMMQFSAAPWRRLSPRGVALCRAAAERHVAMAPYILACVRESAKTGEPIVRAMEYAFPGQGFARTMQQYMLGPDYLVAPVLNDEGDVTVELPAGTWIDDLGERHKGPKRLELRNVPLERMPVYVADCPSLPVVDKTVSPMQLRKPSVGRLGIGMECLDRDLWDPVPAYASLRELGIRRARLQSGWARTEKRKGVYDFGWMDAVVSNLVAIGVEPWISLSYGNPLYAAACDGEQDYTGQKMNPLHSEEGLSAWKAYVRTIVSRYRDRVRVWEVWNEPDVRFFFKVPDGASWAEEYVRLLKETSETIRSVQPEARICAQTASGPDGREALSADLFKRGAGKYADIYAFHAYRALPEGFSQQERDAFYGAVRRQAPHIRFWRGEAGLSSQKSGRGALCELPLSEDMQARWIGRHLVRDLADPEIDFTSYFHLFDFDHYTHEVTYHYGVLRDKDYSRKPSFDVLRRVKAYFDDGNTFPDATVSLTLMARSDDSADEALAAGAAVYAFRRKGLPFFAFTSKAPATREEPPVPVKARAYFGTPDGAWHEPVLFDLADGTVTPLELTDDWPAPWLAVDLRNHIQVITEAAALTSGVPPTATQPPAPSILRKKQANHE